jgi:hypothetical protein
MGEFQDVIHRLGQVSVETGIRSERYRILKILQDLPQEFSNNDRVVRAVAVATKRILEEEFGEEEK